MVTSSVSAGGGGGRFEIAITSTVQVNDPLPSTAGRASNIEQMLIYQQGDLVNRITLVSAETINGLRAKAICTVMYGTYAYDVDGCVGNRIGVAPQQSCQLPSRE